MKLQKNINDTIPNNHIDNVKERDNESLLKRTVLTLEENKDVYLMKKLNIIQIKSKCLFPSLLIETIFLLTLVRIRLYH